MQTYALRLVNNTPQTRTFDLSYSGSAFAVAAPAELTVPLSSSVAFSVTLSVPASAAPLRHDALLLTATSREPGSSPASARIVTVVTPPTWQRRTELPRTLEDAAGASFNGAVVVLGGRSANSVLTTTYAYSPSSSSWSTLPALPSGRAAAGAAVLSDTLYLVGGETSAGSVASQLWLLSGGQWSSGPSLPEPRADSVVVADPQTGRLLVFGGRVNATVATSSTLVYASGAWSSLAPLPVAPQSGLMRAAGVRAGRNVYIAGGVSSGETLHPKLLIFNLDTNTWREGPALPAPRRSGAMGVMGDAVCFVGGIDITRLPAISGATWCFDTQDERWFPAATLNVARQSMAVASLPDGIYTVGGQTNSTSEPGCATSAPARCATVERYATPPASFSSDKSVSPSIILSGGVVTFTIALSNSGQLSATALLSDELPASLTPMSWSPQLVRSGNLFTASLPLQPASSIALTMTVQAPAAFSGLITNTVQISGDGSLTASSATLTVAPPPSPAFTTSAPDTLGQTTLFTATATDLAAYHWDFGDGSAASGVTASHAYTASGTFSATLVVTDVNGFSAASTQVVMIDPAPAVTLIAQPNPVLVGRSVVFTATATGSTLSYAWDFGSSSLVSGPTVQYVFTTPGAYTVTVTITDLNGVTRTATVTVQVRAALFMPMIKR